VIRKYLIVLLALLLSLGMITVINAETKNPVELSADTIEYDSTQGVMTAHGAVKIIRDGAVLTGTNALYNTKTKEALVTGGAKVVKDESTLTAAEVRSYDDNHLVATGNVLLVKADSTLSGPKLDHWTDKQYSIMTGGATLTMPDGVMTADRVEAFHNEDRAVGSGNAHIVSDKRSLDATSDQAVYYGSKTNQGKVVLSGNAHAVQEGNVLTGNTMTIYLDDKAMDAQGRSKLVIKPE
jgi:lipopolysaccharide export system protein LptA